MNATKHTPGPWIIDGDTNSEGFTGWLCAPCGPDNRMEPICHVDNCSHADINLIAAAPEMLEALRSIGLDDTCDDDNTRLKRYIALARAAIAKAEGR